MSYSGVIRAVLVALDAFIAVTAIGGAMDSRGRCARTPAMRRTEWEICHGPPTSSGTRRPRLAG